MPSQVSPPAKKRAICDWSLLRREASSRSPSGHRRAPPGPDLRHLLGPTVAPVRALGQPEPPTLISMSRLHGVGSPSPRTLLTWRTAGAHATQRSLQQGRRAAASDACCGHSRHTGDEASRRGRPSTWGERRREAGHATRALTSGPSARCCLCDVPFARMGSPLEEGGAPDMLYPRRHLYPHPRDHQ